VCWNIFKEEFLVGRRFILARKNDGRFFLVRGILSFF